MLLVLNLRGRAEHALSVQQAWDHSSRLTGAVDVSECLPWLLLYQKRLRSITCLVHSSFIKG